MKIVTINSLWLGWLCRVYLDDVFLVCVYLEKLFLFLRLADNKLIGRQQTLSQLSPIHAYDKKLILLVFVFFFLINIVSSGGHLDWWDGTEAFLVTESMVLRHTARLDPTVPTVKELGFYVNYTVYANIGLQTGDYTSLQNVTLEPVYTVRSLLLSAVAVPFYY